MFKYSSKEREDWFASIQPNYTEQTWHNDIVFHPSHIKHQDFFKRTSIMTEHISPSKICGIEYAWGYNCPAFKPSDWRLHWIEFFRELYRLDWVIDNFKTRKSLMEHIHKNIEPKSVMQYGNHYFTIGGQHRLCLAKFLELESVQVSVHKYELDRKLFKRELNVEKYIPFLQRKGFIANEYKRQTEDSPLFLNGSKETIMIKKEFINYLVDRYNILEKHPHKGWLNTFLKSNNIKQGYLHINDENDLCFLDRAIRRKIRENA